MNQSQEKTHITQKLITFSRRGIVVITIAQFYLIDPNFDVWEVCHGESLHKWHPVLIRLDRLLSIMHFARAVHHDQIR